MNSLVSYSMVVLRIRDVALAIMKIWCALLLWSNGRADFTILHYYLGLASR